MSSCTKCTADTSDGIVLCGRCRTTAYYALANIAAFYADLDMVPTTGVVRRRSNTAADPTGLAAARIVRDPVTEVDDAAVETLNRWASHLAGRAPRAVPDLAPWLTKHLDQVATAAWAGAFLAELLVLERRLRKVAARADTGSYVGICGRVVEESRRHDETSCWCSCHLQDGECDVPGGCGRDVGEIEAVTCTEPLYARRDAQLVRCRCGASWDVRARRQQLVRDAEDRLAPVAVIAHLVAVFTGETSVGRIEARIRQWVQRDRVSHVTSQVIEGRPRRVYRVGDVLDLLTSDTRKQRSA